MFNIIDIIFLFSTFLLSVVGIFVNHLEKYVPSPIKRSFSYGCFANNGSEAKYVQHIEIPKEYFRHFYIFATSFSVLSLLYMTSVYILGFEVNQYITVALKVLCQNYVPKSSATACLITMTLFTVQCLRRLYETHCMQVFAKKGTINLLYYAVAIFHYFGCVLVMGVSDAPLFCGERNKNTVLWLDIRTIVLSIPCIIIFFWSWYEQYRSNLIFASLRRDKKSGAVLTEEHAVPHGRLFTRVSSPHRMCEVVMYTCLALIKPTTSTLVVFFWVLANQVVAAVAVHKWYKKTFKNYPKNRQIIFPNIF